MNKEIIEHIENKTPGRKTKYNKKLAEKICNELSLGKSIREVLNSSSEYPCWQTLRTWINKYEDFKDAYVKAKQDGIEYILANCDKLLDDALEDSKHKDKTDLGKTHLIKAALDYGKWKAERINPHTYGKKNELNAKIGDQLFQIKWQD